MVRTRADIEEQAEEQLQGESGLWCAVLINVINDLTDPACRADYEAARRIIINRDCCFPTIAEALEVDPEELQRRIIRHMRKRCCEL